MTDIVERLRSGEDGLEYAAADEIERLLDALTKIATSSNQLPGRMFVAFAREVLTQAALQEKGHE